MRGHKLQNALDNANNFTFPVFYVRLNRRDTIKIWYLNIFSVYFQQ